MPRTGPRRPTVTIRLSAEGIAAIDRLALAEGLTIRDGEPNRSEMIRRLLSEAVTARSKGANRGNTAN